MTEKSPKPLRRAGDPPHDLGWWLKWVAGICVALTVIGGFVFTTLTVAREQVAAPIEAKLDKQAERDSVRLNTEIAARIAEDKSALVEVRSMHDDVKWIKMWLVRQGGRRGD